MPAVVVVGAQWGDEGKGKVVDFLSQQANMVVRHQGGSNAGHTVVVGDQEYKLHLIPSGILFPETWCVIANGVVVDPEFLVEEIRYLQERGISTDRLRISSAAHVVMPYHRQMDALQESQRGDNRLGTTLRGIGPSYMDKAARSGIRVGDLLRPQEFSHRLAQILEEKNRLLERAYDAERWDAKELEERYLAFGEQIKGYVTNTSLLINQAIDRGDRVLFEGAQGTMLDIDHGTYPFVTSSHPVAGGACIGAGVGPTKINQVYGVAKAYTTRVGDGPFPSELKNAVGDLIREQGHEYGTTTGRPRRIGWLDTVVLRHAARVNGLTGLAVTLLDVLGGVGELQMVVGYRYKGEALRDFPDTPDVLAECTPETITLPGWTESLDGVRALEDLPLAARRYLSTLEEQVGVPLVLVSVGRERFNTIPLKTLF